MTFENIIKKNDTVKKVSALFKENRRVGLNILNIYREAIKINNLGKINLDSTYKILKDE